MVPHFNIGEWSRSSILYSVFSIILFIYLFRRYFSRKSINKTLPSLKCSKVILYFCLLRGLYKVTGGSLSYILCFVLQVISGLCLIFDKERIFRVYIVLKPFVFFYKPETVEVVLGSTVTIDKAKEYEYLQPWLGTGLLTSSGTKWRQRRKLLTPSFHFKILEDFIPIFDGKSCILVSRLEKLQSEEWVDIVPLITDCTLDVICETAMGISIDAQKGGCSEYVQATHEVGNIFQFRVMRPWMYLDFIFKWSPSGRKFQKNLKTIHSFTRKVIKEKKEDMIREGRLLEKNGIIMNGSSPLNSRKRKAFLELLLKHHLKDPSFTEEDIREEVDTFMFEGHDTTAMALCWALYLVGLDEEVQQHIHEEIDDIFAGDCSREIIREDIIQMKYLECVIKEALRLYPSVPFIAREVKESFDVLGYTIKPGNVCFIFPFMLHRDPESFPNPEKFDPERFFPDEAAKRHPYSYVPFSAGPRNCIGQKFALMEEKTILANIFRNFTVTSKDPIDRVNITPNLIIRNLDPLRMHFTPRSEHKKQN